MNQSLTILGLVAVVLGRIAQSIGWQGETVTEQNLQEIMHGLAYVAQIGGLIAAYIGRVRKGDIDWLGRRKINVPTIDSFPN